MSEYAQSLGINLTTHTEKCCEYPITSNIMHLYTGEEQIDKCMKCYEDKEGKDATITHEIVDEGSMQYKSIWSRTDDQPSGHDWIASQTVIKPQPWVAKMFEEWSEDCHLIKLAIQFIDTDEPILIRNEYLPPIVQLQDGGVYEELWELEDYTQRQREVECKWCHLLTPRMFNDCQDCDKPLEHNIR